MTGTAAVVLPDSPRELAELLDAVVVKLASAPLALASDAEVVSTVEALERVWRRADAVNAGVFVEISDRALWEPLGYKKVRDFYSVHLRLGTTEAARREAVAAAIGRLNSMTGERLPPKREPLADAVAAGEVSASHVREVEAILAKIPHAASAADVDVAVTVLTETAKATTPEDLRKPGQHILAHLDPDGSLTDDTDRQRRRGLTLGRQGTDLMSKISGYVTPEVRAKLEVLLDNWAAPGMNNPDDDPELRLRGPAPHRPAPDGSSAGGGAADDAGRQVLIEARRRDNRSAAQRNHDALDAGLDWILGHQALGKPDRIPAELVITVDENDLARRAGVAVTATGAMIPVNNLITLAADSTPWLAVFKHHTRSVIDFGRGRRLATKTQRLALFASEPGCTMPGCTEPFSRTQAHHATLDYARGGSTDVADMTGACGPHNRAVGAKPGQWETTVLTDGPDEGRTGWRRTGSDEPFRVNHVHDPRAYLRATVFDPDQTTRPDQTTGADGDTAPPTTPVMKRIRPDERWGPPRVGSADTVDRSSPVEAALALLVAA
ncbi:DUF222 domain-containing protein [Gordonia sp. X0973]|uniref:HNH endonuclease signature motif containing protein n=1 Tax=Gordonia sp. X0973 TaxID=2742602 RepID=UPI000F52F86B|nr:HNH endonuclease signature motif containing protein [Gordonia sp. X0973]QKT06554.1 DUF222 domain-containing protein [Gordonia sp. X0973]